MRLINANEIETRVQSVKKTNKGVGCILLLYKDARYDMKVLDETYGVDGWQREHQLIDGNLYCTIKIWSEKTKQWISKQDVGTESNTEKEKGQASDSFKRACVNLGIGRELYTSPFIWIDLKEGEYYESGKDNHGNPKYNLSAYVKFYVKTIGYNEDNEIVKLQISDGKTVRFELLDNDGISDTKVKTLEKMIKDKNRNLDKILGYYKVDSLKELTASQATHLQTELLREKVGA